jgi:enterochelin esterase-like enzyme
MLVYTPPGYESGKGDFPVFYLLHGAMDSDESWSTVGRAGFILEVLDNDELKKGLELVWFATGKDDFLIETSRKTVKMLQAHGFTVNYKESNGGHTWLNWRDYLCEFAPLLFQ